MITFLLTLCSVTQIIFFCNSLDVFVSMDMVPESDPHQTLQQIVQSRKVRPAVRHQGSSDVQTQRRN